MDKTPFKVYLIETIGNNRQGRGFKMEPEVHIIEKYFQEVLLCFTMTNIRCKGGKEIDLLAINPKTLEKFHIEARVTVSGFKIAKIDTYTKKGKRIGTAHRIGLDFFNKEKFEHEAIKKKILDVFGEVPYRKILVVWNVEDDSVIPYAKETYKIEIWKIQEMLQRFGKYVSGSRDDVLRTMELVYLSHE